MSYMKQNNVKVKLQRIFKKFKEVKLAILFGSYAINKATPISDIDLALIVNDKSIIPYLSAEIAKSLSLPEEKISIINLESTDPTLKLKILSEGVIIINRGVKLNVDVEAVEVYELEMETCSKQWLKRNPIDIMIIRNIISRIKEDINDLQELSSIGYEKVKSNKHLRKSFERTMQTIIESMIDLLRHLVTGLGLGVAAYYKDYVELAKNENIINTQTSKNILELIPIRHTLVHRYRHLNHKELWKNIEKTIKTARKIVEEVENYLRSKHET